MRDGYGDALAGNFGIGVVVPLSLFPGVFFCPIGDAAWGTAGGICLMFAYRTLVAIVFGTVEPVLVAALYEIAETGRRPDGFGGYGELDCAFSMIDPSMDESVQRTDAEEMSLQMTFARG